MPADTTLLTSALANDRPAQCTASVIHAGTETGVPSREMQ